MGVNSITGAFAVDVVVAAVVVVVVVVVVANGVAVIEVGAIVV